jgi:hypothetical protein
VTASLYVYYKAPPSPEVADRVRAMQSDLAARSGIQGRLMRRRDQPETWMEIYEAVGAFETFEPLLEDAVARHALGDLVLPGQRRHAERFVAA